MRYKAFLLSIYFALLQILVTAQSDTILRGYPPAEDDNSVITEAQILSDNRIIFTQVTYGRKYQAYIVDEKGDAVYVKNLEDTEGFTFFSLNYIIEDTARYIFVGSARKDSRSYFITFSLDSTLKNLTLIDTVELQNDTWLSFESMKFNPDKSCWKQSALFAKCLQPGC